jgi:hypothetical protein
MKLENYKNAKTPKEAVGGTREGLTDPVVDDLIAVRERWDEEFEKKQAERRTELLEAEKEGRLTFSKYK